MRSVLGLLCLSLLVGAAFAQSDRGTITGTVVDPEGAIVPRATVEAKNLATGVVFTTISTDTGSH